MFWSMKLVFIIHFQLVNQIGYAEIVTNLCWKTKCQCRHKNIKRTLSRVWKPMSNWSDVNFTHHFIHVHCCKNERCLTLSERAMCFSTITGLKKVQTILPRSCDEEYLISLALKRRLSDKSAVNKQNRPAFTFVNRALAKLIEINPF